MKPLHRCHNYGIKRFMDGIHVGTRPLEVARKIRREYPTGGIEQFRTMDKTHRRFALAAALNAHADNRQEYEHVMNRRLISLEWDFRFNPDGKTPHETVTKA